MRAPIFMMIAAAAASLVYGQDKAQDKAAPDTASQKSSEAGFEAAIIPVKTLTGASFNRLVSLLGVFNARLSGSESLRTIVVYAPKDVITQVRRVVEELDKPGSEAATGRNIEMTLQFLRCSTKAQVDSSPLPPDLESVGRQLRAATQYKDVQLIDTMPLRLQEGKDTQDTTKLPIANFPMVSLRFQPEAIIRKDQGRYVRFDHLMLDFQSQSYAGLRISTAGDFMEGQKTVIGKVSGPEEDASIFVVISLKILD